jgi:hypothetical protein
MLGHPLADLLGEWLTCLHRVAVYSFIHPFPGATCFMSEIQTHVPAPETVRSDTCSQLARFGPLPAG